MIDLLLLSAADPVPKEEDVVAGWTAFALFGIGILAVVVLGFSLVKRLKNVDAAAAAGKYDPSTPKPQRGRPARGLAAVREQRAAEAAAAEAGDPGDPREPN